MNAAHPPPEALLGGILNLFLLAAMAGAWIWFLPRLMQRRTILAPAATRRCVPWGLGSIFAVLFAYLVTTWAVKAMFEYSHPDRLGNPPPITAAAEPSLPPEATQFTGRELITQMTFIYLVMAPVIPLVLRATSRSPLRDLGLSGGGVPRDLRVGVVACLILTPICYACLRVLQLIWTPIPHPVQKMLQKEFTPDLAALAVLSAVVLAPLFEEILFRGILLPWLDQVFRPQPPDGDFTLFPDADSATLLLPRGLVAALRALPGSWIWPNLLTATVFASLHGEQWPAPVPLFILALGLGWVTLRTGRLWAAIALHACFNALATFWLILLLTHPQAQPEVTPQTAPAPASVGVSATP